MLAHVTACTMLQMAVRCEQALWTRARGPGLWAELGIESPGLAQHVENALFVDFAHLAQSREMK
jgi:hypothetical protein